MSIGLALRVFVPFALGYYMSYVFRAINAVIAPDLVRDVGLDAASLGMLTSMYYLTFAAVQLPLGLLLDRIGPRRTEVALLLFAAAGALIFALAQSLSGLALGRGLIGLGVSACLMSGVTAFARWFPRERLAFVNGCLFTAGGFGAIAATTPVEAALAYMDWRGVFLALAVMTLAVAAIIFILAPEKDPGSAGRAAQTATLAQQIAAMRQIVAHPMFTRIMPFAILTQSANLSMPTLWAGPWLADVARLTRDEVAAGLFAIAAGLMAGFFCMGLAAERLQKRGIDTATTMIGFGVLFMIVQLTILTGVLDMPRPLWALFAFMGTNGSLAYAALSQQFPAANAGRVNTVLNLFVFVGAFAAQWGIGAIIHLWPEGPNGGFAPEGYAAAFWTMLGLEAAGLLWIGASRAFKSTMPRDIGSAT